MCHQMIDQMIDQMSDQMNDQMNAVADFWMGVCGRWRMSWKCAS